MSRLPKKACLAVGVMILAFAPVTVTADVVEPLDAAIAVQGWLARDPAPLGTMLSCEISSVLAYAYPDEPPVYFIVNLDPSGFVVVSADDQVEPIIAFVPEGTFDPSPDNPLGALVNADVVSRVDAARWDGVMEYAVGGDGVTVRAAEDKWTELIIDGELGPIDMGIGSVSDVRVSPSSGCAWNQSTPYSGGPTCYNYYTPNNFVCGCVATAMAQLMRFHQHPAAPSTTGPFTISVSGVQQSRSLLGGDGAGGNYDWANMVLVPSDLAPPGGPGISTNERQAIGALCHDAGVAVSMSYASSGSGTDTLKAADAFTATFGYSNAIKGRRSDWGNIGTPLNTMVNPNLDAGYPVLLGITGPSGGHAIVCDGYGYNSSTLYHHLNMGWGGSYNAWYALPNIETFVTFTSVYKCVYNVYVSGSGEIISGRVLDESSQPIAGAVVTAARSGGGNYTDTTDANGVFGIAKVPADSTYTVSVSKVGYSFTSQQVNTGTSTSNSTTVGNVWGVNFTGGPAGTAAQMRSPTDGSTLSGSSAEFTWTAGTNVDGYCLSIGTTQGGVDIRNLDCGTDQSVTVNSLPIDGSTIYVRLKSLIGGTWEYNDYTYATFDGTGVKAELTAPAGDTLASSAVEFTWTAGVGASDYALYVGSTQGGNEYFGQVLGGQSKTVSGLPTDGSTVYVRLHTCVGGDWYYNDYSFTAFTGSNAPAEMTSPADQSDLSGSSVTFNWSAGSGVTEYALDVGSSAGASDYLDRNVGTAQSWQVTGLPTDGSRVYVRLWSLIDDAWQYNDYWYTAFDGDGLKATLTAPAGPNLSSPVVDFTWTAGTGVSDYALYVGSTAGGKDYFAQVTSAQSRRVEGLPTDGSTVYVRLFSCISGNWVYNDYSFTAYSGATAAAAITSPADQSTLASSAVTLNWDGGVGVSEYRLSVGSSLGASDYLYRNCGTQQSWNVTNLPTDGSRIYVRLESLIGASWEHNDYWYTAVDNSGGKAALTDPAGPNLSSSVVDFTWTQGTGVSDYALYVGSTVGGAQYFGQVLGTTAKTVSGLPTDGSTVHVRLFSCISGVWYHQDYSFTAFSGANAPAEITSPADQSTLADTTVEFQWNAGVGVTQYWLKVGSSVGASDYLDRNCGTNLSWAAQNLPTDGSRVYVRLLSLIDGSWQSNDYWYTAKDGGGAQATLTAPVGPVLAGASDTFSWTTGTGVKYYALWVGSSVGAKDYYARTLKSTMHSQLVTTLPTDGSTVYVRLYSLISGVWYWEDYTYTASN